MYRSRECEADHDRTERSRDKAQRERERKRKRVMSAAQRCVDQVAVAVQQRDPGLLPVAVAVSITTARIRR